MAISSQAPDRGQIDQELIAKKLGFPAISIELLAGDGSDRCYYRIISTTSQQTYVLMQLLGPLDRQALKQGDYDWIVVGWQLAQMGVTVPNLVATFPDEGLLVIEDYGNTTLEDRVRHLWNQGEKEQVFNLYKECIGIVKNFLRVQPSANQRWCQRQFDTEKFLWELNFFKTKFLENTLALPLENDQLARFTQDIAAMSAFLSERAKYFVHRDFHSRNLMFQAGKLAVIDFQDARLGPAFYDLVSLVFDSYVPFDKEFRQRLMEESFAALPAEFSASDKQALRREWKATFLQRQLKAIGSFAYLTLDKKRGDYLKYVLPALQTIQACSVYDERWPFLSGDLLKIMEQRCQLRFKA